MAEAVKYIPEPADSSVPSTIGETSQTDDTEKGGDIEAAPDAQILDQPESNASPRSVHGFTVISPSHSPVLAT